MHVADAFTAPDPAAVVSLLRSNPFAAVVSVVVGEHGPVPEATHVPVVLEPGADVGAALEGAVLWGHMARANPQWRGFEDGGRVLVVFTGPQGYVSPTTYGAAPAAPTWNYAAVHVTGEVALVRDPEAALRVLTATVEALEELQPQPWDMTGSLGHFRRILPGTAAFTVRVESVRAVFKLGQDEPEDRYRRVQDDVRGRDAALAAAMAASNPGRPAPAGP